MNQPITYETRRESHQTVDKPKRYNEILSVLTDGKEMTAREVMKALGYHERNSVHPRLNELCNKGILETVENKKKYDTDTGRPGAIYRRKNSVESSSFNGENR